MTNEYLNRVLIFLQQEMPEHRGVLSLNNNVLVFNLPDGSTFQPFYETIFAGVNQHINRIRQRECDLNFRVWSPTQERDFKILK